MESNGNATFRERSADTLLLMSALEKLDVGETMTYEDLTDVVKRSVQGSARHNLNSARKILERERRRVFGIIMGVGVKRLNDKEIAVSGVDTIKRVKRMASRGINRMTCVIYEHLDNDSKIRFNTDASILGALAHISKGTSIKKIENKAKEQQQRLAIGATLEMFTK